MSRLGRLVTSLPMSLVTLYPSRLRCDGLVSLAFSQSGQSPDLVAPSRFFGAGGARTVAFVNDAASPLAQACQWVLPLHAGAEPASPPPRASSRSWSPARGWSPTWEAQAAGSDAALLAALAALPAALDARGALRLAGRAAGARRRRPPVRDRPRPRPGGGAWKPRSSSRRPAACRPRPSPAPNCATARWRWWTKATRCWSSRRAGRRRPGCWSWRATCAQRGARVLLAAPAGTPGAELPLVLTGHEDLDPIASSSPSIPMVEALARAARPATPTRRATWPR